MADHPLVPCDSIELLSSDCKGLSPLFRGLTAADVAAIVGAARAREYRAHAWICREVEKPREFFLLESGLLRLNLITPEGHEVLLRIVKPNEVFGYIALNGNVSGAYSAITLQPCRILAWDAVRLQLLLRAVPNAAINLLNVAADDVERLYERTRALLTLPARERVRWALGKLAYTVGTKTSNAIVIDHGIHQRDVADLAGTTIFTVCRELGKLEQQEIVKRKRGRIVVVQPEKLTGL